MALRMDNWYMLRSAISSAKLPFGLSPWKTETLMSDHATIPTRTAHTAWNDLLDQVNRLDAINNGDKSMENNGALLPWQIEQDNNLEQSLVMLLSRFDQERTRLSSKSVMKNPIQALQILTDMVNQAADFSDQVGLDKCSMADSLVVAGKDFPRVRLLEVYNGRLSASQVTRLYQACGNAQASRRVTFRQVTAGMVRLLDIYCAHMRGHFHSPDHALETQEAATVFLNDLAALLSKIVF